MLEESRTEAQVLVDLFTTTAQEPVSGVWEEGLASVGCGMKFKTLISFGLEVAACVPLLA